MDARVYQCEHPDRGRHVSNTRPHAQHGAGMMIGLEGTTPLSLGDNDGSVEDLVKLAEIEDPAPESESLVPDTANIRWIRLAIRIKIDQPVLRLPMALVGIPGHSIAQAARTMHFAERINSSSNSIGLSIVRDGVFESANHGHTGHGRVYGEKDVVEDDEGAESARLADSPGLVAMTAVILVEEDNGGRVDGGNGQRDLEGERAGEDIGRDREGCLE